MFELVHGDNLESIQDLIFKSAIYFDKDLSFIPVKIIIKNCQKNCQNEVPIFYGMIFFRLVFIKVHFLSMQWYKNYIDLRFECLT